MLDILNKIKENIEHVAKEIQSLKQENQQFRSFHWLFWHVYQACIVHLCTRLLIVTSTFILNHDKLLFSSIICSTRLWCLSWDYHSIRLYEAWLQIDVGMIQFPSTIHRSCLLQNVLPRKCTFLVFAYLCLSNHHHGIGFGLLLLYPYWPWI